MAIIFLLLLGWFCSGYYDGPVAVGIGWTCKIALGVVIILFFYERRKLREDEKHSKPTLERYNYDTTEYHKALRKWEYEDDPALAGIPLNERLSRAKVGKRSSPLPDPGYGEHLLHTPRFKEKLRRWNAENPDSIFPGPNDESVPMRQLRLSLLTSEQLATIPFRERIELRNSNRHSTSHASDGSCRICGSCSGVGNYNGRVPWYAVMCDKCSQRYREALEGGWEKTLPDSIDPQYKIILWRFQQCVAIDLLDGKIGEQTAKAEMNEAISVARQVIAEEKRYDTQHKARVEEQKTEQQRLKEISQRLS